MYRTDALVTGKIDASLILLAISLDDGELYNVLNEPIPEGYNNIPPVEEMLKNCKRYLETRCKAGPWKTYQELEENVNRICNYLVEEFNLQPGNRVLLRSGNNPWLAACWLAIFKLGAVAVGTMPLLRSKELSQIIELAKISHAICDQALADEIKITFIKKYIFI